MSPGSAGGTVPEGPRFPDEAHRILASLRAGHFWFTNRRISIGRAAEACLAGRRDARVLELGCGDGEIAAALSARWWTVGLERRLDDLLLARRRGVARVVAAEGEALPFLRRFDLVGLFDVVEHVPNDVELLRTASALVVPGGRILMTVPADPRLWSKFDRYAGHYRRYTRGMLIELLESAGLEAVQIFPLFRMLWPLGRIHALVHRKDEVTDPREEYQVGRLSNWLLGRALSLESRVFGDSERGAGTSWLATGHTPLSPHEPPASPSEAGAHGGGPGRLDQTGRLDSPSGERWS